jgi:hypothetical protein
MTDEQIRILLSLTRDEAKLLLDHNEYALYRNIQNRLRRLVRDYDVQLPLNCLQFFYFVNSYSQEPCWRSSQQALF